jgi:ABC-type sulfate/molybdate transport systems ATPase subunit
MSTFAIDLRGRIGTLELDVRFETSATITAVIGPNGAGKSTLLRMLAGAPLSVEGTASVQGGALIDTARNLCVPPDARRLGYLPQGLALFPHLSALENVAFGCAGDRALRERRARELLQSAGAAHLADRLPKQLSGGEAQRVALARALAPEPRALLLDEPLAALDVSHRRTMRSFLGALLEESGRPALLVTHDARDVLALAQYVVVLERGKVVQQGTAEQLAAAPATELVAELLGSV